VSGPAAALQPERAVTEHGVRMHFVLDRGRDAQRLLHHLLVRAVQGMDHEEEMGVVKQGVRQLAVDMEETFSVG